MAALFGATAVRSPLTDLDGVNDLTPEQLEAAIDATLLQTAEPARTLHGAAAIAATDCGDGRLYVRDPA